MCSHHHCMEHLIILVPPTHPLSATHLTPRINHLAILNDQTHFLPYTSLLLRLLFTTTNITMYHPIRPLLLIHSPTPLNSLMILTMVLLFLSDLDYSLPNYSIISCHSLSLNTILSSCWAIIRHYTIIQWNHFL